LVCLSPSGITNIEATTQIARADRKTQESGRVQNKTKFYEIFQERKN